MRLTYLVRRIVGTNPVLVWNIAMVTIIVSSKGQIVLPATLRRKLGMGAGARLEVVEQPDGLKLRIARAVEIGDVSAMAGMIKAPSRGIARRLEDFDPADLLRRARPLKR